MAPYAYLLPGQGGIIELSVLSGFKAIFTLIITGVLCTSKYASIVPGLVIGWVILMVGMSYLRCMKAMLMAFILLFVVMMVSSPATGMMIDLPYSYLIEHSDAIVTGNVISVESRWNDNGTGILTEVIISVDRIILGDLPNDPVLIFDGGTVGNVTQWVEGVPIIFKGDYLGLFLNEHPDGTYRTVGLSQGLIPLAEKSLSKSWRHTRASPDLFEQQVYTILKGYNDNSQSILLPNPALIYNEDGNILRKIMSVWGNLNLNQSLYKQYSILIWN